MRSAEHSVHLIAATVGFLSFFLLWLAVLWGMFLRNGWALTWVRHSTLLAIHTTTALLGLCLGAVHAGAQLAVPGGHLTVIHLLVPFGYYRDPIGIGVGVLGLELMTAVALSVMIQRWLGYSRWRALHALTYVAFTLVVAHILISGTDLHSPLLWVGVLAAWLVTVFVWLIATPLVANLRGGAGRRAASRQRTPDITVNVDARKCARFGFCEHEAPAVFRLRSDGRLAYRATVAADEASSVIRAAEVCPTRAIMLSRVPTTVLTPHSGVPARPVSPGHAPAYREPPTVYGEGPAAYGERPPAYGEPPAAYGSPPPGWGNGARHAGGHRSRR